MTFTSSYQENYAAESREHIVESAASVHVEDAPCIVIRAVRISDVYASWQPRTMHAWLT
jgi:hypothetical protein